MKTTRPAPRTVSTAIPTVTASIAFAVTVDIRQTCTSISRISFSPLSCHQGRSGAGVRVWSVDFSIFVSSPFDPKSMWLAMQPRARVELSFLRLSRLMTCAKILCAMELSRHIKRRTADNNWYSMLCEETRNFDRWYNRMFPWIQTVSHSYAHTVQSFSSAHSRSFS